MKSIVLCYNLKNTKKGRKIAMIFASLGYRVRHVEKAEYALPVGALTGMISEQNVEEKPYEGEGFSDEMLVIYTEKQQIFDRALQMMRKEKSVVALKAVLTKTNYVWDSLKLHEEISEEHLSMTNKE